MVARKGTGSNNAVTKKVVRSFGSNVVGASAPVRSTKSAAMLPKKKG